MSLKEELMKAIGAHGQWKMRLRTAINCGTLDIPISVVKAEDQCEFGKWLFTQHAADIVQDPRVQSVRQLHAEFHKIAGHVAELAVSGKGPEAESLMSDIGEFTVASGHLSEAIMAWKNGS